MLEPSSFTNEKGKVDKRAGFDPFSDQQKYSAKYHKKRRTVPEFGGREYSAILPLDQVWEVLMNCRIRVLPQRALVYARPET